MVKVDIEVKSEQDEKDEGAEKTVTSRLVSLSQTPNL